MTMASSAVVAGRGKFPVKVVGFAVPLISDLGERGPERTGRIAAGDVWAKAKPDFGGLVGGDGQLVPEGALCPPPARVDRRRPGHHVVIDPVLGVRGERDAP